MSRFTTPYRLLVAFVASVAAVVLALTMISPGTAAPGSASHVPGRGTNDFGMTHAFFAGQSSKFTYSHGYFCDTSVPSKATTKCEVGQKWRNAPSRQHDPLFITVPLGFAPKMVDCPANLTCVDHPTSMDLTRLEPALKPLYPHLTDAQLSAALQNFKTPEHDHFITDTNQGKREWWDVYVVGVTSPTVFRQIHNHRSYGYIQKLIRQKNPHVTKPIPSNLFLFFSVQK